MAIEVSAVLAGVTIPQTVQIEVTGLEVGDGVTIEGELGSDTWVVRGAEDVSALGAQVLRRDNLTPVNTEFTYTATVNGVQYTSNPITVPYSHDYVLTTLDGKEVVDLLWVNNGDPIDINVDQHFSQVPGRSTAVVRYAPAGGESGQWQFLTESAASSRALHKMIASSAPLILRSTGLIRDFPAVRIVALSQASRTLVGAKGENRLWDTAWREVSDPFATVPVTAWTLEDFSTVWNALGGSFDDLNAFIVSLGGTFDDINRFPWDEQAIS